MFEVLARFEKGSPEYEELMYRITCGQLYQQNEIDKIKGIVANPMPKHWYDLKACETDFDKSICADVKNKKPTFMLHIYPEDMKRFNDFKETRLRKCRQLYRMTVEEMSLLQDKTNEMSGFIDRYNKELPVGNGACIMNKICEMVEFKFKGFLTERMEQEFDYTIMKTDLTYTKAQYQKAEELFKAYNDKMKAFYAENNNKKLDKDFTYEKREFLKLEFYEASKKVCKNEERLCNILLDLCYTKESNKQLVWDLCSEQIIKNLKGGC